MKLKVIRTTSLLGLILTASLAHSAIISITTGDTLIGDRNANLITNGSFELITYEGNVITHPGFDIGWTPNPTHIGGYPTIEVPSIYGWTSSYSDGAYGLWGPLGLDSSVIPDGSNVVYFGNSSAEVDSVPVIAANGEITNVGVTTDRPGGMPITLLQSIGGLSIGSTYELDFWASGEGNIDAFTGIGIFGVEIDGDLRQLLLPSSSNSFGVSQRFQLMFTADDTTADIKFYNWGHVANIGNEIGSELILDDVILNASVVPLPDSIWLFSSGLLGLLVKIKG